MLLVYGPRSDSYDFGPGHPLTPRRFGPGIDLLRSVGAEPGLAPEPAMDDELAWCHTAHFIETVKRFGADPSRPPEAGIAPGGDVPPFAGMHEAGSMVAGGSIRAVEAVLRGDVEHAFHPGGGLHHAMPARASGFCIYDDPALAIARARRAGLRVLYVDFDAHHGDGVQAIHRDDPDVLTVSFHETGRYLFPGTGSIDELGEGTAAGTVVNLPMEPGTGETAWLAAVRTILPELCAAFGPDLIVSQHGSDGHAWDPLAHLLLTTTAMGEAARLVDRLAHRYCHGRWLATGGGGYDAYRVVPRAWSLVWLAGAHREVPGSISEAWRTCWADDGLRFGQSPAPDRFEDAPNAGFEVSEAQVAAEARTTETLAVVRRLTVPALLRTARDGGWWDPGRSIEGAPVFEVAGTSGTPHIIERVDPGSWANLGLAAGVIVLADPTEGHALIAAGLQSGLAVTVGVVDQMVVGLAATDVSDPERPVLLALGVARASRRQGLARAVLACHIESLGQAKDGLTVEITVAERDPFDPLDVATRRHIARRLLEPAGFEIVATDPLVRVADPDAVSAVLHSGATI